MFVQSALESLPSELNDVAAEVYVNFPWGSLLAAVAGVHSPALTNIRKICRAGARLTVTLGLDAERDRSEIERLNVPCLTAANAKAVLGSSYEACGFDLVDVKEKDARSLQTSWSKRLANNPNRKALVLRAEAR